MGGLSEAILVQIVATIGVVLAAGVPAYIQVKSKLQSIGNDAKEARKQTQNDHVTNLRDELDERHEVILETIRDIARDVRGLRIDHMATRKDIGQLRAEDRTARGETSELRRELRQHMEETAPYMPAVHGLVQLYVTYQKKLRKTGPGDEPPMDIFDEE